MFSYPATPRQKVATALCFAVGVSFLVAGARMAYWNIEDQQARVQARKEFVRERIRRYFDD